MKGEYSKTISLLEPNKEIPIPFLIPSENSNSRHKIQMPQYNEQRT
jgi:hypothetical protein